MKTQWAKGFIAVMVSAVFFGIVPLLVQTITAGGGSGFVAAFYRFLLSVPVLCLYLRLKKIPLRVTRQELGQILLITLFGYGGTTLLLFNSYHYMPSGMATTVHFMYPVFTILGSMLFLKEKVQMRKLLCAALCVAGVLLMGSGGADGEVKPLGLGLALVSGMTYAFYILYLDKSSLRTMPELKLILYMNLIAAALLGTTLAGTGAFVWRMEASAWIAALALAAGGSFVGAFLFQRGVRLIGPQSAAILSTFEPITSLLVGVLFCHEHLTLTSAAGCILILASVVIIMREDAQS